MQPGNDRTRTNSRISASLLAKRHATKLPPDQVTRIAELAEEFMRAIARERALVIRALASPEVRELVRAIVKEELTP
jgi:hypothetical protein